ncbi:MAG: alpha-amylase family glycosyl hydrolase, partial [Pseudomonadota bacterium]
ERLASALHLDDQLYQNPYELMSFYDNHDMARLDADENGFIDANHWLFTARGIPVVYYGSESAFQAGRAEHGGNRDYFGPERIEAAKQGAIYAKLQRIAELRASLPALQRGLQFNIELTANRAAFLRVLEHGGVTQTALVLLNKGDEPEQFEVDRWLSDGTWRNGFTTERRVVGDTATQFEVAPHDVAVWVFEDRTNNLRLLRELERLQSLAER